MRTSNREYLIDTVRKWHTEDGKKREPHSFEYRRDIFLTNYAGFPVIVLPEQEDGFFLEAHFIGRIEIAKICSCYSSFSQFLTDCLKKIDEWNTVTEGAGI